MFYLYVLYTHILTMIPYKTSFKSGQEVVKAVKKYNTSLCKGFRSKCSSGKTKIYICDDVMCPFQLNWYRKMGKGICERNLSEIEEGHWYLSKFVPHGGECVSCPKTSAKELAVLDAFEGAVKGTIGTAGESLLKSVTANVHDVGSLSHAMVQRARDHVKHRSGLEDEKSYRNLPALCDEILKLNPGST